MRDIEKRVQAIEGRKRKPARVIVAYEDPETKQLLDGSPWLESSKPIGPVGPDDLVFRIVYTDDWRGNENATK